MFSLGARPVLADVDPRLGLLDPDDAEARITPRTKAIIAVHLWGMPADMARLRALADRYGLALLEDGSHAQGAALHNREAGTFGTAAAFSMNGPKPLSAGEGGFVATDDTELYYRLLIHGQYNKRCRTEIPADHALAPYAVTGTGLKLRIHPLAAALALSQLARLDEVLAGRRRIAKRMIGALSAVPSIEPPEIPDGAEPSWYALALRYRPDRLGGLGIERFLAAVHDIRRSGSAASDLLSVATGQAGAYIGFNLAPSTFGMCLEPGLSAALMFHDSSLTSSPPDPSSSVCQGSYNPRLRRKTESSGSDSC